MALIGAVVTIGAALAFALAGFQMVSLRTESGNTVAELFDNAVGVFAFGMAGLTILGGLAVDRLFRIAGATVAPPTPLALPTTQAGNPFLQSEAGDPKPGSESHP